MLRQFSTALRTIIVLTVIVGLLYPLAVTAVGQVAFGDEANGSKIRTGDEVVGSALIGQAFDDPDNFHSRPSAAGDGYDATASAATNLGPLNEDLKAAHAEAEAAYRSTNNVPADVELPSDAITSSASGLDPQISVDNARLQAARVAVARQMSLEQVNRLIDEATRGRSLGFGGDEGVNVLELNRSLEASG